MTRNPKLPGLGGKPRAALLQIDSWEVEDLVKLIGGLLDRRRAVRLESMETVLRLQGNAELQVRPLDILSQVLGGGEAETISQAELLLQHRSPAVDDLLVILLANAGSNKAAEQVARLFLRSSASEIIVRAIGTQQLSKRRRWVLSQLLDQQRESEGYDH